MKSKNRRNSFHVHFEWYKYPNILDNRFKAIIDFEFPVIALISNCNDLNKQKKKENKFLSSL